jgi:2-C-methyl-D-erythritol 2,4-cyclodiphosphate synthase
MIRVGIGYDSHRFAAGGPMVLGGIRIESSVHLAGHSDGDAVCHALTDAVLGAAGLGDIGAMFPDTAAENRNRDSVEMLTLALERVQAAGLRVGQVDVVVIAQEVRIAPHRDAMRERLAIVLGVHVGDVSIKGKTNETMGWIGRGEGLAVMATATLVPSDAR